MTLADPVSPDLKRHLRTLKLGQLLATLPDRLTLARQNKLPHADFLELLLSDEVTRRENGSAARRARTAASTPTCASTPGTPPPPSATTSNSGTSWSACGSPKPPTAP